MQLRGPCADDCGDLYLDYFAEQGALLHMIGFVLL